MKRLKSSSYAFNQRFGSLFHLKRAFQKNGNTLLAVEKFMLSLKVAVPGTKERKRKFLIRIMDLHHELPIFPECSPRIALRSEITKSFIFHCKIIKMKNDI